MKKLITFILIILFLTSCGDGMNPTKCFEHVQQQYPNSIVWRVPDQGYKFVVVDSNDVFYIETMSNDLKITTKIKIK